ncbi:MAG TPA: PRC-barrel domain-containing protein [Pilimelia sp.]|nr:PRC-barrel domain-containing protein [Pilimelia sp.]
MSLLLRATELVKRPVVTLDGEDVAQIKDIVYDDRGGTVSGFTLSGRGLFAGPLKVGLPAAAVRAVGPDAVMIADAGQLTARADVAGDTEVREGNVLGDRVVTETGRTLGTVVDVILRVGADAEVVGYEVEIAEAPGGQGTRALVPLSDTLAVSGEAIVVPGGAVEFVSGDTGRLAALDTPVARFRGGREGEADAVQ